MVILLVWLAQRIDSPIVRDIIMAVTGALVGYNIWTHIAGLVPKQTPVEFQANFDDDVPPLEEDLVDEWGKPVASAQYQSGMETQATIFATLLSVMYLPKDGTRLVPEIMKRVSFLPRATEGMEVFFKSCVGIVETIINAILGLFSKTRVDFADHTTRTVKEWVKEAEEIHLEILKTISGSPDQAILVKAQEKIIDGYKLKSIISEEKLKFVVQRAIDKLEITMRPYAGAVGAIKTFRQEPEFALFLGGSKQGKTTLVTRVGVITLMLAGLVTAEEALHHLWQKGDTKYFESYFGQKCLVMDDCFQEKAVPGMESNEFLQLIRMVGNWSCPLNMATLDMKGKFFFLSALILGTTNATSIGATGAAQVIHCPEAVVRRIHHPIHIEATGDYLKDGGLDYEKFVTTIDERTVALQNRVVNGQTITQADVLDIVPWDAWLAKRVDFATGQHLGGPMDLKRFVVELALKLKTKKEQHTAATENIKAFSDLLANAEPMDLSAFLNPTILEEDIQPQGFFPQG